jgi:hypothetical protein
MRNFIGSVEKTHSKLYTSDRKLHELIAAAITENWTIMRKSRIELKRLAEIGDGSIEIALGLIGAAPVDKGHDPIALRFLASSGDDSGATGDARLGIGAATPRPRIVFGETIGAERNAKQPSECDTR